MAMPAALMTPVAVPKVVGAGAAVAAPVVTVPVTLVIGVSVMGGSAGPVIAGAGATVVHAVVAAAQGQGGRDQQKQGNADELILQLIHLIELRISGLNDVPIFL